MDKNLISEFGEIVQYLEEAMNKNKLKIVQWPLDDVCLVHFGVEQIQEKCNEVLKCKRVIFVRPLVEINDRNEQLRLIGLYHEDKMLGGHCGMKRLYARLRSKYFWPHMYTDVYRHVKNCEKCLLSKPKRATREPMAVTETPQRAFDSIIVDTIGPLPKTFYGNTYAVTAICDLSK